MMTRNYPKTKEVIPGPIRRSLFIKPFKDKTCFLCKEPDEVTRISLYHPVNYVCLNQVAFSGISAIKDLFILVLLLIDVCTYYRAIRSLRNVC